MKQKILYGNFFFKGPQDPKIWRAVTKGVDRNEMGWGTNTCSSLSDVLIFILVVGSHMFFYYHTLKMTCCRYSFIRVK